MIVKILSFGINSPNYRYYGKMSRYYEYINFRYYDIFFFYILHISNKDYYIQSKYTGNLNQMLFLSHRSLKYVGCTTVLDYLHISYYNLPCKYSTCNLTTFYTLLYFRDPGINQLHQSLAPITNCDDPDRNSSFMTSRTAATPGSVSQF